MCSMRAPMAGVVARKSSRDLNECEQLLAITYGTAHKLRVLIAANGGLCRIGNPLYAHSTLPCEASALSFEDMAKFCVKGYYNSQP